MEAPDKANIADEKIIGINKPKLVVLIIGCCASLGVGVWVLLLDPATIRAQQFGNPRLLHFIAALAVVFFAAIAALAIMKLARQRPGLIFSASGIVDNTSGLSSGLIPWSEIEGAQIAQLGRQKRLVIRIRDPQGYLAGASRLQRHVFGAHYKAFGSPLAISGSALNIGFFELIAIFNRYQEKYLPGNRISGP